MDLDFNITPNPYALTPTGINTLTCLSRGTHSFSFDMTLAVRRYDNRRRSGFSGHLVRQIGGRVVKTAVKAAFGGGRSKTQHRSGNGGDNALTDHFDSKVDYRKKRPTRRRKMRMRRTRKFRRRVEYANLRNTIIPSKVNQEKIYTVTANQGFSAQAHALMHTVDGLFTGPGYDVANPSADWREFFREGGAGNQNAWDNASTTLTSATNPAFPPVGLRYRQIMSHGCVMEVTVRNVGVNSATVNCYRVMCRRDVPSGYGNIVNLYDEGFRRAGQVSEVPLTGANPWDSQIRADFISATPFQSSLFCRHFTIIRRTKYELSPGQFFSMVTKESKLRRANMTTFQTRMAKAGWTEGFFFDFNGVPILDTGIPVHGAATLAFSVWRRYSLSFMPLKNLQTSLDTTDI